jgi:hypothetical protein
MVWNDSALSFAERVASLLCLEVGILLLAVILAVEVTVVVTQAEYQLGLVIPGLSQ